MKTFLNINLVTRDYAIYTFVFPWIYVKGNIHKKIISLKCIQSDIRNFVYEQVQNKNKVYYGIIIYACQEITTGGLKKVVHNNKRRTEKSIITRGELGL